MKIVCISDTHTKHRMLDIPKCDILIHAGDWSNRGEEETVLDLFNWFGEQPCKDVVCIAGNHDFWPDESPISFKRDVLEGSSNKIHYLQAGSTLSPGTCTVQGLKFFGSPWTPWFHSWAFNFPEIDSFQETAAKHWDLIPDDTDIVITHGPPHNILDQTDEGLNVGSAPLASRLRDVKPKMHVFGHIHEGYGGRVINNTYYINASMHTRKMNPTNPPVIVDL